MGITYPSIDFLYKVKSTCRLWCLHRDQRANQQFIFIVTGASGERKGNLQGNQATSCGLEKTFKLVLPAHMPVCPQLNANYLPQLANKKALLLKKALSLNVI